MIAPFVWIGNTRTMRKLTILAYILSALLGSCDRNEEQAEESSPGSHRSPTDQPEISTPITNHTTQDTRNSKAPPRANDYPPILTDSLNTDLLNYVVSFTLHSYEEYNNPNTCQENCRSKGRTCVEYQYLFHCTQTCNRDSDCPENSACACSSPECSVNPFSRHHPYFEFENYCITQRPKPNHTPYTP